MKIERRHTHAGAAGNRDPRWRHGARRTTHAGRRCTRTGRRTIVVDAHRPRHTHTHSGTPVDGRMITVDTQKHRLRTHRPTHPIGNTTTYAYTEANPTLPRPSPRRAPSPFSTTRSLLSSSPHLGRPTHTVLTRPAPRSVSWISFTSSLLSFPSWPRLTERFLGSDNVLVWVE
jgi:hypothetical protein